MKLRVTEGSTVVVEDKELQAGDTFEKRKDALVTAWLDAGHVEEVTDKEK